MSVRGIFLKNKRMNWKDFFGTRNFWLILACLLLAILSGLEFDKQARQAAENTQEISAEQ